MTLERAPSKIYTLPANRDFAATLATGLLAKYAHGTPEDLAKVTILLPTRRGCRSVQDAFLRHSKGHALLLPRLQPIGDVDEEDLILKTGHIDSHPALHIPPALPDMQRTLYLTRLIRKFHRQDQTMEQTLSLARALGQFMDRIYTEGLALGDLPTLVPDDFADHWGITLKFLGLLSVHWPKILAEKNMIDSADRRNRLITALGGYWRDHPPTTPIIAAGSTGSIPATGSLLLTIAGLPQGEVILPGLDSAMDPDSWAALDDTHPQFTMKIFLQRAAMEKADIALWPDCPPAPDLHCPKDRITLASEIMRPAETADLWRDNLPESLIVNGTENLHYFACETMQDEAMMIALHLRETLEIPEKTAILVTPDRALAERTRAICRRWGIDIDDSAGQSLHQTLIGSFARLVVQAVLDDLKPSILLALLRHPFCILNLSFPRKNAVLSIFEHDLLRGLPPKKGINGLKERLEQRRKSEKYPEDHYLKLSAFLDHLSHLLLPLLEIQNTSSPPDAPAVVEAHLKVMEDLAQSDTATGAELLWADQSGEAAATVFRDFINHAEQMALSSLNDYADMIDHFMSAVTIRPRYGTHPRLAILGPLEARLLHADTVILAGLNEGSWPADSGHDPWMSRPMQRQFGLPVPERQIGLAAHDFVQGFCACRVIITRSAVVDGTPSIPSRWLQRLETLLNIHNRALESLTDPDYHSWVKSIDSAETVTPYQRPKPCPPVAIRPRKISVTGVETWLKDPYGLYAKHVLRLRALPELEKALDAADRGSVLHSILERFIREIWLVQNAPPSDESALRESLEALARDVIMAYHDDPDLWAFWLTRFSTIADWFLTKQRGWAKDGTIPVLVENQGQLTIQAPSGAFTLTARPDRIDRFPDGSYAILDYKSGGSYSGPKIKNGTFPQLPLESVILEKGGFPDHPADSVQHIGYWVMRGGSNPGQVTEIKDGGKITLRSVIDTAQQGFEDLMHLFDQEDTPYYAIPALDNAPQFNDYEHLARVKEWGALGDNEEDQAA